MARFAGKTALVTGAASGIGRAVAERLAEEGVLQLILVDRDAAALDALKLRCRVERIAGDVADEALWDAVALPDLDFAVINAGVAGAGPIVDLDFTAWRRILSVNLDGAFLTLRAAMRAMAGRGGAIVAVSSAAGSRPKRGWPPMAPRRRR